MAALNQLSAKEIAEGVRSKKFSAVEVAKASIDACVAEIARLARAGKQFPLGGFPKPSRPAPAADAPRALIFSPHPDDECIIGALALRLQREAGFRIVNVAVTQGSNKARQAGRWKELEAACDYLEFELVQTIPGGLATVGLKPEDINYVINSHYHFDHCGGNKYLTKACTICHTKELEASGNCQPFEHLGYSDLTFAPDMARKMGKTLPPDPALDIYTPRFETLTGDQEIAKGVWLMETPGHTAGHYSLLVELKGRRPMLFTADACYGKKNMDMMVISSFHLDPVASVKSMQRLKDLAAKHDAELFYSHDPESYPSYLKAPAYYA